MSFNPSQSSLFWRLLLSGVALFLFSVGWLFTQQRTDTQEKISASTIYHGREPKSDWVAVKGRLKWDQAAYEGTDYFGTWYVPLVNPNWEYGNKVKLIVRVSSAAADDWGDTVEVNGILDKRLPDVVRRFFQAEGPELAENVLMLRAGAEPGTGDRLAHVLIVLSLLAIGGAMYLYDSDPDDRSRRNPLLARPRTLGPRPSDLKELTGEIGPDDPMIQAREDEVRRWMRDHGLTKEAPEEAPSDEPEEQLA
jgi:hypothetical protein